MTHDDTTSIRSGYSQSPKNFWEAPYFPALDGLRALSLLLVIGGHVRTGLPIKQYFSGGLGVGIFFVLSGFLITILLLREELAFGSISLGAFYIRRAFRILPPYFLTIGVYLLVALIPSQHELRVRFLNTLPYFLTWSNEYVPKGVAATFTHSWSLSVEEKFYFVWPLLFFIVLRKLKGRWAIVPITIIPLLISPTSSLPVAYFSLLLGCCVAIALHALRGKQDEVLAFINRIPTMRSRHCLDSVILCIFGRNISCELHSQHGGSSSSLATEGIPVFSTPWIEDLQLCGETYLLYVPLPCILPDAFRRQSDSSHY